MIIPLEKNLHPLHHAARGNMIGIFWAMTPFFGIQIFLVTATWFVAAYLETSNATAAAKQAGFSSSQELLKLPQIRKEIKVRMGKVMAKKEVTAERVVEELAKIAFANIDDFVDDEYRVKPKPRRRAMAAVQEVTTETIVDRRRDVDDEDKEDVKRVRMRMYSKLDALNSLGRNFGIFTDKVEVSGDLGDRLDRAFDKLAQEGGELK